MGRLSACIVALVAVLVWAQRPADATILSGTVPVADCQFGTTTVGICYDTGYLSDQIVGATDGFIGGFPGAQSSLSNFTDAFNNWNAANGNAWQLLNGGTLPVTLGIDANVSANQFGGGINPIIVSIDAYSQGPNDPTLAQLVWTQGLFSNYTATSVSLLSPPIVTLDTYSLSAGSGGSGGAFQTACETIPGQNPGANNTIAASIGATASGQAFCDPIYPFQYGEFTSVGPDPFGDGPQGAWPDDAFRGIALLSTVTFDTDSNGNITDRILTVYQGVSYGFTLSAPEPSSMALLGPTACLVIWRRNRRG